MKTLRYPLIAVTAGLMIASAGQALAGGPDSCCSDSACGDGITASPKVRAQLNERCMSRCVAPSTGSVNTVTRQTEFSASPRVQQMRSEQAPATAGNSGTAVASTAAGYQPAGSDGITASPKVRAQLDERRQTVEIAPLK